MAVTLNWIVLICVKLNSFTVYHAARAWCNALNLELQRYNNSIVHENRWKNKEMVLILNVYELYVI